MTSANAGAWVVYSFPLNGSPEAMRAVCDQAEWETLDRARPGFYTLIREGITSEGEAERLARGSAGAARPRHVKTPALPAPATAPTPVAAAAKRAVRS
jgi:hypothetical protein